MKTSVCSCDTQNYDVSSDAAWIELYPKLLLYTKHLVYKYWIPCWSGQEKDIAEDVAQETARRIIERSQKAARGEATPIDSMERMMMVIALNNVRDLRRRDKHIIHILSDDSTIEIQSLVNNLTSLSEVATEQVYCEWLFLLLAREIVRFPLKQRRAILIDLAKRMQFDTYPTALQAAFLEVGINLRDYQQALPETSLERTRHASLLSYAYKRLAQLCLVQKESQAM